MNRFKDKLDKQLSYCCLMNNFNAAIYVSSKDKVEYVIKVLKNIIDNTLKIARIEYKTYQCLFTSQYEYFIAFSNGSSLKVIIPTKSSKGNRINGCLIDKDISEEIKRNIIYSQLFPKGIFIDNYKFESWDNVKKE